MVFGMTRLQRDQRGMCPAKSTAGALLRLLVIHICTLASPAREEMVLGSLQRPVCKVDCHFPLALQVAPGLLNRFMF